MNTRPRSLVARRTTPSIKGWHVYCCAGCVIPCCSQPHGTLPRLYDLPCATLLRFSFFFRRATHVENRQRIPNSRRNQSPKQRSSRGVVGGRSITIRCLPSEPS